MIAPTDQQGFEQLRNASIKLAERWQREAVAKVTPAVKWEPVREAARIRLSSSGRSSR